ncbi:MAG: hypothetical protein QNJ98_09190 [Planctomycetota bacterium]|nr:hypothetical protein [Planctomycetota bacterium]
MSTSTLVSIAAILLLGGASVVLYAQNQALEERLDDLEARSGSLATGDVSDAALPELGGETVADSVERLDTAIDQLSSRLADTESRIAKRETAAAPDGGGGLDLDAPALDEKVRDIVLDMTGDVRFREKLGLRGAPNLPKKPAFGQLAEVLELDATQEDAFRKDLMELKEGFLAIIAMERDDGIVLLEEIQKVESLPEHDPKRAQTFMRLFTMKIPGTEKTYVTRLVEMTSTMRRKTEDYLRPEQVKRFNSLDIDLMGVEID